MREVVNIVAIAKQMTLSATVLKRFRMDLNDIIFISLITV